jgi:hypothetical protein
MTLAKDSLQESQVSAIIGLLTGFKEIEQLEFDIAPTATKRIRVRQCDVSSFPEEQCIG